eukprot:NODE_20502_length_795_cov_4.893713.p1 GENE.NODE_20502_length_795_cov_4.893713~~NODE_20502_length_795_cov_4.893713.p1  ORF type:complete len:249 (+),score=70.97 NODE_20502_length_795_cov_4.893713:59-748(+)
MAPSSARLAALSLAALVLRCRPQLLSHAAVRGAPASAEDVEWDAPEEDLEGGTYEGPDADLFNAVVACELGDTLLQRVADSNATHAWLRLTTLEYFRPTTEQVSIDVDHCRRLGRPVVVKTPCSECHWFDTARPPFEDAVWNVSLIVNAKECVDANFAEMDAELWLKRDWLLFKERYAAFCIPSRVLARHERHGEDEMERAAAEHDVWSTVEHGNETEENLLYLEEETA